MRRVSLAVALVGLALAAGACSIARKTPDMRHYVLALAGPPPSVPAPLQVGSFTADSPYAGIRLALRTSPYEIEYYTYHRWAADPRAVLAAALRDWFETATVTGGPPPLELSGRIRALEGVETADGRGARIALDIVVERAGRVLLDRSYDETERAEKRSPGAVVAALSRALERIMGQVVAALPAPLEEPAR
jgi:ABC-type uncharacterized transport system auxiliary subunit